MAITAGDVLDRARRVILDETSVRWPLGELRLWLNDGLREIALHKPSATAINVVLTLIAGTYQTLPSTYLALLSAIRNIAVEGPPRQGGKIIRAIDRDEMDAQDRDWHDQSIHPVSAVVKHVIYDPQSPRAFYVFPPNNASGKIECTVSKLPTAVAAPGSPEDIASYSATLDIDDIYLNALVDYVVYRAYSKDAQIEGVAQRAAAHYGQFAQAIGLKLANERNGYPNRKVAPP